MNELGAERRRRLLGVEVELFEHRLDGADRERQCDERERDPDGRARVSATSRWIGLSGP